MFKNEKDGALLMDAARTVLGLLLVVLFISTVSAARDFVGIDDYDIEIEYDDEDAESGETFRLELKITNTAGETREDIEIELDPSGPLDIDGDDSKTIGSLDDEESKTISFRVEVDEGADEGEYEIEFDIQDNVDSDNDEFIIDIDSNDPELIIGDISSLPSVIAPDDEDIRLMIIVENIGDGDAKFTRARLDLPKGFSASNSYSDTGNLGTIFEGGQKTIEFFIDSDEFIESGRHEATLILDYENEDDDKLNDKLKFDLPIKGRPQFIITDSSTEPEIVLENGEGVLSVRIQNVGEETGEETSLRVFENSDQPFEFNEKTNFIGELEPGESGVGKLSFNVDSGAKPNVYILRLQIRTINEGNVLVEEKSVSIEVGERVGNNNFLYMVVGGIVLLIVLGFLVIRGRRS